MAKPMTKEDFDEVLENAIETWGFTYVWEKIKYFNKELNFDDDDLIDYDDYYNGEDEDYD